MKSSTLALAALLVVAAGSAGAQQGEWSFGYRLVGTNTDLVSEEVGTFHSGLVVDSGFGLGADVAYLVTDNIGIEASLAASYHELTLEGELLDGADAGDEWLLPATVTFVYHLPMLGHVQPYLGVGVAYVGFLGYSESAELEAIGVDDVDTDGSLELVAQAGLDYELSDRWSAVLDVKYTELSSDTDVDLAGGQTYATVPVDGELWQVGLGFEYRFGYRH